MGLYSIGFVICGLVCLRWFVQGFSSVVVLGCVGAFWVFLGLLVIGWWFCVTLVLWFGAYRLLALRVCGVKLVGWVVWAG